MSKEKSGEARVVASNITLVQKTITRLDFDGMPRGEENELASGSINLRINTKWRPSAFEGRDAVEAVLDIRSRPTGPEPFYTVSAEVRGLYQINDDAPDEAEAKSFVERRGMEELYDFFRFVMTIITTDGHYGQMVLPTIAVARLD